MPCSVLKRQNSYEFIHDLKNSNSIQEFTGVYLLKWRHGLLECLLMKKLLNDQGLGCRKEYITSLLKTEWLLHKVGRSVLTMLLKINLLTSINYSYLFWFN